MISKYWEHLNSKLKEKYSNHGYENFKRFFGYVYNDDMSINKSPYHLNVNDLWNHVYDRLPEDVISQFEEPLEGNPFYFVLKGKKVTIDLGCALLEYHNLKQHVDFNRISSIMEIGGGYGRTAYVITKLHPHIKYTLCDIDFNLNVAKRYLKSVAKWGRFRFVNCENIEKEKGADLIIAINCLGEMTREAVATYFDYAKKCGYFYLVTWDKVGVPLDNILWRFPEDYPIDTNWKVIFQRPYIRKSFMEALYKI
jgi:SAM-dependent methyltransferase